MSHLHRLNQAWNNSEVLDWVIVYDLKKRKITGSQNWFCSVEISNAQNVVAHQFWYSISFFLVD